MMKTLIVEDDKVLHALLGQGLKDNGYQVLSAYDGEEGLQLASKHEPDLLIVDMEMPKVCGSEMIRRLRLNERFQKTPIIVLSSHTDLASKQKAFECGADDFIEKSFELGELLARMNRHIKRDQKSYADELSNGKAKIIGVHGMRGGVGTTSVAVNLALALHFLWNKRTLLVDSCAEGGQVDFLLSGQGTQTWGNLNQFKADALDPYIMERVLNEHKSGIHYLASPRMNENVPAELKARLFEIVDYGQSDYDYIVIDLGQAWDESTLEQISKCGGLVSVISPDVASMENCVSAFDRYRDLEIDQEQIRIVLNNVSGNNWLSLARVEATLDREIDIQIPFSQHTFRNWQNSGTPLVDHPATDTKLTRKFHSLAFKLSKQSHVSVPPAAPTTAWMNHFQNSKLTNRRGLSSSELTSTTAFTAVLLIKQLLIR